MTNDTILMTGCASGIGRHLANVLYDAGYRLMITDINGEALEQYVRYQRWERSERVMWDVLDVRAAESWQGVIERMVSAWDSLDVLMNVAGYLTPGYIHEIDIEEIDRHLDINTKGVMLGTHFAARRMVEQGAGHIVNIASLAGIASVPGLCCYTASKHAVRGFSLATAFEVAEHGVHVTVICPDAVDTPMLDKQVAYDEAVLSFSGPRPLTVKDIGDAVLNEVLPKKPLEVVIAPRNSGRGITARVVNAFPDFGLKLGPMLKKRASRAQELLRRKR